MSWLNVFYTVTLNISYIRRRWLRFVCDSDRRNTVVWSGWTSEHSSISFYFSQPEERKKKNVLMSSNYKAKAFCNKQVFTLILNLGLIQDRVEWWIMFLYYSSWGFYLSLMRLHQYWNRKKNKLLLQLKISHSSCVHHILYILQK